MIEQIMVTGAESIRPTTMSTIEDAEIGATTFAGSSGAFVRVLDDLELERQLVPHTDLLIVTAAARDMGCTWVFFDREEEPHEGLPDYGEEWKNYELTA